MSLAALALPMAEQPVIGGGAAHHSLCASDNFQAGRRAHGVREGRDADGQGDQG